MPTYVYKDPVTGFTKEVFHGMSESPKIVNEATGNVMEREITGGAGFIFKGQGFYVTDHRSSGYKAAEKVEATAPTPKGCSGGDGCGACAAA